MVAGLEERSPFTQLPWKSVGLFELAALPSVGRERWEPVLRAADVLLVEGGDALFLAHWMRESGVADLLPDLENLTYVGLSAGSMVMTPSIGKAFTSWEPPDGGDETLGFVPFSLCPHVAFDGGEGNPIEVCEKWAVDDRPTRLPDRQRDGDQGGRRRGRGRLRRHLAPRQRVAWLA